MPLNTIHKKIFSIFFYFSILYSLIIYIFYPGLFTPDSLDQLNQALKSNYTDWHPPIMAWLWNLTNTIFPDHSGLLFLHTFVLWLATSILYFTSRSKFSFLFLIIPFLPTTMGLIGIIWKDAGTAFFLLLAISSFFIERKTLSYGIFWTSIAIAIAYRYNTLFSSIPIVFYFWHKYLAQNKNTKKYHKLKPYIFTFFSIFFILIFINIFNYKFLSTQKTTPSIVIIVDDLSYISTKNNTSFIPGFTLEEIKESHSKAVDDNIFRLISNTQKSYDYQAIKESWATTISQHPIDYIEFRSKNFLRFLGFSLSPPFNLKHPSLHYWTPHSYNDSSTNSFRVFMGKYIEGSVSIFPFLFTAYFWIFFSAIFIILIIKKHNKNNIDLLCLALLTSSLINFFSYLLVANAPYYRYYYWSILSCVCTIIIYINRQKS